MFFQLVKGCTMHDVKMMEAAFCGRCLYLWDPLLQISEQASELENWENGDQLTWPIMWLVGPTNTNIVGACIRWYARREFTTRSRIGRIVLSGVSPWRTLHRTTSGNCSPSNHGQQLSGRRGILQSENVNFNVSSTTLLRQYVQQLMMGMRRSSRCSDRVWSVSR